MKRLILLILFFILFIQNKVFLQNKNDFFPLSQGSYYLYSYYSRFSLSDFHYGFESVEDSGWIKYSVESFIKEDTLILWNIKETHSIHTHIYKNIYDPKELLDTCYWTADTSYFGLKESLTGNHKLLCNSSFGIWNSPIAIAGSFFTPTLSRYNDDGDSLTIDFNAITSRTTLKLKRNIGITSCRFYNSFGNNSPTSKYQEAVLIGQCIASLNGTNEENSVKHEYLISQNYPNPFNPSTTIRYSLAKQSHVTLKIYDLLGREVAMLVDEEKAEGMHTAFWKADNIPSGVYFYELRAGNFIEKRKMMLVR